jgi:hypothetical protein
VFYQTLRSIKEHNAGKHSWKQGITEFTDMTWEEFKAEKLMEPQHCSATSNLKLKTKFREFAFPDDY